MTSVANRFNAENIKVSEELKKVFMRVEHEVHLQFPYTFSCKGMSAHLFFDMKSNKMLWVDKLPSMEIDGHSKYRCSVVSFWIENDLPVPSVKGFMNQEIGVLAHIGDDFKEKLAAYTLDCIINS